MPIAKTAADPAFWDASGLVLLAIEQPDSKRARAIERATGPRVVWWGSQVEVSSALARLAREGVLGVADIAVAQKRADTIQRRSFEVQPSDDVRARASALLHTHPLRAGDALQLAAAFVAVRGRPRGRVLVCFDERLGAVARACGFDVRP